MRDFKISDLRILRRAVPPPPGQLISPAPRPTPPPARASVALAALTIAGAALLAYRNTFSVPLLFDDISAIVDNFTLRQLWPPWQALSPPPGGTTTAGRPLLNLTLALNYAVGGTAVRGYHVVNLVLHICAGLTFFGVLRRTLTQPLLRARFAATALPLAGATALLWVLHPLQTESVTYIVQRAESLVGLCYLLTLYAFIRGAADPAGRRWWILAVAACACGMASKEVMVSAPLMVWCYDRTFLSGGFRVALRQRPRFYAALGATWLLLAGLVVVMGGNRGTSAGFGLGVSSWSYAIAQADAIIGYLRLAFWPQPLVFDYGIVLPPFVDTLPRIAVLILLIGGALYAFLRGTAVGFAAAFFFAVLAPSSSFIPITSQTMAEHRVYLPLAAVLALLGPGAWAIAGRRGLPVLFLAAAALGVVTFQRNHDYRSSDAIWHDTALKRPENPRAFDNLGLALLDRGLLTESVPFFERALQLNPTSAHSHAALATVLFRLGRLAAAHPHFQAAVTIDPLSAAGHGGLGAIAYQSGDYARAAPSLQEAIRLDPLNAGYRRNLAAVLHLLGRSTESLATYREALRLAPDDADLHADFGGVALSMGQYPTAITHATTALGLNPSHGLAHNHLAAAFNRTDRPAEALVHALAALARMPGLAHAHHNAAEALAALGRIEEALHHYQAELARAPDHVGANHGLGRSLLRLQRPADSLRFLEAAVAGDPRLGAARDNLGAALLQLGRTAEAVSRFQEAVQLNPNQPETRNNLGVALQQSGRVDEAIREFKQALALHPSYAQARENLAGAEAIKAAAQPPRTAPPR
jgi:tetratricopeptide (TPR) repeat protein